MSVTFLEPSGSLRLPKPGDPQAAARRVWGVLTRGRAAAGIGSVASDLALFGAFMWGFRGEIAVIRRAIELARRGSGAFRDAAVAFAEHHHARGVAPTTLVRRWRTLAALARAISSLWPDRPPLAIGSPPDDLAAPLDAHGRGTLLERLVRCGAWRDAAIIGLVLETSMASEQIVRLRVRELATLGGSDALRRACGELARVRDAPRAAAFVGRGGAPLDRKSVDRICERHGTTVAALRRATKGAA